MIEHSAISYERRAAECVRLADQAADEIIRAELLSLRVKYLLIADRLRGVSTGEISNYGPKLDVWRAAHNLIKRIGDGSEEIAAGMAEALRDKGAFDESLLWIKIAEAISELERLGTQGNPTLN